MNSSWGIYGVRGRLQGGKETSESDRAATSFFVRWRVNGKMRRRTLKTRAHARSFRDVLICAKVGGWEADDRGWPLDPSQPNNPNSSLTAPAVVTAHSFETYVDDVWWPNLRLAKNDKDRIRHRRNADLAVELLRYQEGDSRLGPSGLAAGDSLAAPDLNADDIKAALVRRRSINGRTAAMNARRLKLAIARDALEVEFVPLAEVALPATVRDFFITLSMIVKAGIASGVFQSDPLSGASALAPKPRRGKMSHRIVPTLDELFDVADVIATLGPITQHGAPQGARFRSLILCGGTLGPRPGELVAHCPDWVDWDDQGPSELRFHRTEASVYSQELTAAETGRRSRPLKHRDEEDFRCVPLITDVEEALRQHFERGYALDDRTWTSPRGTAHLDWGNIRDNYWRPALSRVFGGTRKDTLATAAPGILRKTAITFWMERGIAEQQAADWAGHTGDVQRIYYSGRSALNYKAEVARLERRRES